MSSGISLRAFSSQEMHLQEYVGEYASTNDFAVQEQIRTADVAIKSAVEGVLGAKTAHTFFVNGWGQIIGASYLLNNHSSRLKTSETFNRILISNIDEALTKATDHKNPFENLNVRGFSKKIMMHPTHPTHAGKYFDWKTVKLTTPISHLNEFIMNADLKFTLTEGKLFLIINSKDETNIFNKLWNTDFPELLIEHGYSNLEKNCECPHLTLVNSNVIAQVREQFETKYGNDDGYNQFTLFIDELLKAFNENLSKEDTPVHFTELASTYSEDYPPFEEVLVGRLESFFIKQALTNFEQAIEKKLGVKIPIPFNSTFHLTLATKYRQPNPDFQKDIQKILEGAGTHAEQLTTFWLTLVESSRK